jgi:hypothetical protein
MIFIKLLKIKKMLHNDLYKNIVNCFRPKNLKELKRTKFSVVNLALINKRFYYACKEKLHKLKRMNELRLKYHVYNHEENEFPQLLDAVFTGCKLPFGNHSITRYNSQVKGDILEIIELMPSSINCNKGFLRCREDVTVLAAACFNLQILNEIIQLLLEKGADPFKQYNLNNNKISILKDMRDEQYLERRKIIETFNKLSK